MKFIKYEKTSYADRFICVDKPNQRFFKVSVESLDGTEYYLFIYSEKGKIVYNAWNFESLNSALDAATKAITNEV